MHEVLLLGGARALLDDPRGRPRMKETTVPASLVSGTRQPSHAPSVRSRSGAAALRASAQLVQHSESRQAQWAHFKVALRLLEGYSAANAPFLLRARCLAAHRTREASELSAVGSA